jgi:hypothetical protein
MKIGEFFEKHVQWIAMGLAAAWLLWVGWTYGVNRPTVELDGQALSPGAVDAHIRDSEAEKLAKNMGHSTVPSGLVDVPDFTDAFVAGMMGQPPKALPHAYVRSDPPIQQIKEEVRGGPRPMREKVKELPAVIVATDLLPLAGRTLVLQPPPAQKLAPRLNNGDVADAAKDNNEARPQPNIFDNNQNAQQGQNGAVQQVGAQLDKTWVTIFAKLNMAAQIKEFERVHIPPIALRATFTEVQLQRQEVHPDGQLGEIETVKGLPMNEPPLDRKMAKDFIAWSSTAEAQKLILVPKFYDVVRGTAWTIPQRDGQGFIDGANAVNDNNPPAMAEFNVGQKYQEYKALKTEGEKQKFLLEMSLEQRRIFREYRLAEQEKERRSKAPARTTPRPGQPRQPAPRPGTGAGRGNENFEVAVDPALLREMYADADGNAEQRRRRFVPGEGFDSPDGGRGRRFDEEGNNQPQQQGNNIIADLRPDQNGNVDVWAHDETAKPGRTYRYRLRVVVANPLFEANLAADPKINAEPYLPLDPNVSWSEWTKPVAIPSDVDMMLVNAQVLGGKEIARFRVKRFQEGQVNEAAKPFEVAPGDLIGGVEKAPPAPAAPGAVQDRLAAPRTIDYSTNWTVVDIRPHGNNDYKVRIMDPQGRLEVRTVSGDRNRFREETPAKPVAGAVGVARPNQN